MRWFAVIYPREDEIKACLDMMIFLANPKEKDAAHITIRGPSHTKIEVKEISASILGTKISVIGAGSFFESHQNTVYLKCGSDIVRKFWNKPEYPFNPHITIYDGQSRGFASRLHEIFLKNRLYFQFIAGDCRAISSSPGQKSLRLLLELSDIWIAEVLGEKISVEGAAELPDWHRLMFIERICVRLNWISRTLMTKHPGRAHAALANVR